MKKIFTIVSALFLTVNLWAQAPEKMSYQAVIRDASNSLTTNQVVGMQISILQTDANGTAVYVETHSPTTNANGLVSLEIGTGSIIIGDFSAIDWSAGPYFIKTETDPTGGTNYTITGTSQLLSVPYALHAKTADSITGTVNYTETDPIFGASVANGITIADTANWNNHTDSTAIANLGFINISSNKFYLGQDTLGGIVFYLYKDVTGTQHGLIVNKNESTAKWQSGTTTVTNADRTEDGAYNTGIIINSPAVTYVTGLSDGGFTDWYLPSIDELNRLFENRDHANKALRSGGFTLLSISDAYWSSTEYNISGAFRFRFNIGNIGSYGKSNVLPVRAVRAF